MPQYQRLPDGLDPVQAGRFGLWLLGVRSHQRAQKRTFSASRVSGYGLAQRLLTALMPWTVEEYPGHLQALAEMCNVSRRTVEDWLYRPDKLPRKHARRLSDICREKAAEFFELAEQLEAYAERERTAGEIRQKLRRSGRGG